LHERAIVHSGNLVVRYMNGCTEIDSV